MSCSTHIQISITIPHLPLSHWPATLGAELVPSRSEIISIRGIVGQAEGGIDLIDANIERLGSMLSELRDRRAELQTCVQNHKALLAPIRRLPNELLSEIFLYSDAMETGPGSQPCQSQRQTYPISNDIPLTIQEVCRRWRSVSVATPGLWSVIDAWNHKSGDYEISVRDSDITCKRLKQWLERSGEADLYVAFSAPRIERSLQDIATTLAPSTHRWETLVLKFSDYCLLMKHLSHHLAKSLTRLRILNIQGRLKGDPRDLPNYGATWENAPYLRDLAIAVPPRRMCLPWAQLTTFQGRSLVYEDCFWILQQCHGLEYCYFNRMKDRHRDLGSLSQQHKELKMENLHTLLIDYEHDSSSLIDCLILPSLRALRISSWRNPINNIPDISSMLLRSSCSLEKLDCRLKHTGDLSPILIRMPDLVELWISRLQGADWYPLHQLLTLDKSNPETWLCPKLRTVSLKSDGDFKDNGSLLAFITSRCNFAENCSVVPGVAKLENARLYRPCTCSHQGVVEHLDLLRQTELHVGWCCYLDYPVYPPRK